MVSTRVFRLLTLAAVAMQVAEGTWADDLLVKGRELLPPLSETPSVAPGNVPSSTPVSSAPSSTQPPPSSSTPSVASETPSSSSSPSSVAPSSTPVESSSSTPVSVKSTSTPIPSEQSSAPSSSSKKDEQSSTTFTPVVSTSFAVQTKTNSDGQKTTMTTAVKTTTTPGLNTGGEKSTSGMSDKTRNTVIGVVVGVGGAVVLGALALVGWRVWGRRRHHDESDGLMEYTGGYHGIEKNDEPGSSAGPTGQNPSPFQSTLENYHQPTNVNASANF